jgi:hypothetical protein
LVELRNSSFVFFYSSFKCSVSLAVIHKIAAADFVNDSACLFGW